MRPIFFFILVCVFPAAGTCLPNSCLTTMEGYTDTEQGELINLFFFFFKIWKIG
jgi:hypothetical protein